MQKESGKEQLGGAEVRVCVEGGGVKITQTGRTLERTQQGRERRGEKKV